MTGETLSTRSHMVLPSTLFSTLTHQWSHLRLSITGSTTRYPLSIAALRFGVNAVFTGHIHAYQRTHNVGLGGLNKKGPIHITIGAGGRDCKAPYKQEEPEEWIATRDATHYGYGKFTIYNETHAEWHWNKLATSVNTYNTVRHSEDLHLPGLDHDRVVLENTYFL